MSLRSFIFETGNAPRRCFVLMVIFLVMLLFTLWDGADWRINNDGPTIYLENPAKLRQHFAQDTITTTLSRGDSLRILGIDRSSFGQKWLVETHRGNIGWVDASDLAGIGQIITDGKDQGDTVNVKAQWLGSHIHRYIYVDKEGNEHKRSTSDFMPAMDGIDHLYYERDAVGGVCTQKKFEKLAIGNSFAKVNKKFGSPVLLRHTSDGMEAQYSWKVFNPSTGQMWKPNVVFGKDSIATSVEFANPTKRAAGWLKVLPLASTIIDCPLTSVMIRGGKYTKFANPMPSTAMKILMICGVVVVIFSLFCWMFCTQVIPTLLMGWLIRFPKVFYCLNDSPLKWLIFVVTLFFTYVWAVVMMAWGMFPFWSIIIFIVSWYTFTLAVSPLCEYPHIRCPKCRHLYTIKFDHEEFSHSTIEKGADIVKGKLLGENTYKRTTYTRVTTTYSDGRTSTHDTDFNHFKDYYNVYQMIDYEVTYRLDHYRVFYKCSVCGHIEETTAVRQTEIGRKVTGSHTEEFFKDSKRTLW